ncbi:hypothetical protein X751_31655 [Mesorhizobium sp. LNJC395A00]|nr:hypothetical protein X751_31655 [Mesorhizobium sp. LNJC395A00]
MIRALASILVAGLVCAPFLTSPVYAQSQAQQAPLDEATVLDASARELYEAGKNAEPSRWPNVLCSFGRALCRPIIPTLQAALTILPAFVRTKAAVIRTGDGRAE